MQYILGQCSILWFNPVYWGPVKYIVVKLSIFWLWGMYLVTFQYFVVSMSVVEYIVAILSI